MELKKFRPITPGQRHKIAVTFDEITTSKPEKSLLAKRIDQEVGMILVK